MCLFTSLSSIGEVKVCLVTSKSRVSPIKSLSIPRLVLCGALLLSQLIDKLKKCLNIRINATYYWTDSIVIHWLNSSSRNWTIFVANRVSVREIQSITSIKNWRHISSSENSTDPLSRGVMPDALLQLEVWWHGPK